MTGDAQLCVFVSADLEGVAGITADREVSRGTPEFGEACRAMTLEVNAAVVGAFDAGADRVVVASGHADMGNLAIELLDPRADVVHGSPRQWGMMAGLEAGTAALVFLGYHAKAGTAHAVMDHTFATEILDVQVNGESYGEIGLNAAYAGALGVPVVLVTGDSACCAEAVGLLPWVATVEVKVGLGRFAAVSRSPERSRAAIEAAARTAISSLDAEVFRPPGPFHLEIEVARSVVADLFALVPGSQRTAPRTVSFTTPTFASAYQCLMTWCRLLETV